MVVSHPPCGFLLEDYIWLGLVQSYPNGIELKFKETAMLFRLGRIEHDENQIGGFRSYRAIFERNRDGMERSRTSDDLTATTSS